MAIRVLGKADGLVALILVGKQSFITTYDVSERFSHALSK